MAKKDLIAEIVEENQSLNADELEKNYTVPQLEELQKQLRAEKETAAVTEKTKYRLKDPNTQYAEVYGGGSFTLAGEQERELPTSPSRTLLDRIEAGFIVEVK